MRCSADSGSSCQASLILALATLFLAGSPPRWVIGAGAGAGAASGAVAGGAGITLAPASRARRRSRVRWIVYVTVGSIVAATRGTLVVVVLIAGSIGTLVAIAGGPLPHDPHALHTNEAHLALERPVAAGSQP